MSKQLSKPYQRGCNDLWDSISECQTKPHKVVLISHDHILSHILVCTKYCFQSYLLEYFLSLIVH